jgi:hypothetical protein
VAARGGVPGAALRFAGRALAGRAHEKDEEEEEEHAAATTTTNNRPRLLLSDIFWSALFAGVAVAALGAFAAAAPTLPFVGQWHRPAVAAAAASAAASATTTTPIVQPFPLLLSSFGALCVLLFARPESDAVRVWPVVAGQLAGAGLALACLTLLGPGLWVRALGMAAVVGFMMWADCAHPPGGALALFAMDHWGALQGLGGGGGGGTGVAAAAKAAGAGWAFCVWPSLALTLGLLMPLGWLCNHMKRTARFDWPRGGGGSGGGEGGRREQQQEQQEAAVAATPLPPRPATPSPPGFASVDDAAAAAAASPAADPPVRRRFYVRSSDGGGWIEDMT